jgi:haloalkane dehalogenase
MQFLRTPDDRFQNLPGYPFAPHYVEVCSGARTPLRMHYVDEGPSEADPVLMVHGQPTWSYLYRKMIPVFAASGHRAIAPDLLGFGRSDKPTVKTDYTFERHIDWLHEFVVALDLRDITLIGQDWGGAIALGVLAREPDRFARVVAANTMLHTVDPDLAGRIAWSNHGVGDSDACISEALLNWIAFSQRAPDFDASMAVGASTSTELDAKTLAAYDAPFPSPRYKAGVRQFPILIPITRSDPGAVINRATWKALADFDRPFLTAFADGDPGTTGWDTIFQERVPGAAGRPHTTIQNAGHFIQEDAGDRLAAIVVEFIENTPKEKT